MLALGAIAVWIFALIAFGSWIVDDLLKGPRR
jgi:hypothetical protein